MPDLADPVELERNLGFYAKVQRLVLTESQIQECVDYYRANPNELTSFIPKISEAHEAGIFERYGVYCLSTHSRSELMWAHYSDKHQGICLEFNVKNKLICAALKVSYETEYPEYDLTDDTAVGNLFPLLAKSAVWSYEDEFRLIAEDENAFMPDPDPETPKMKNNFVGLPEGALTGIIVGCSASAETLDAVRAIIKKSPTPVRLMEATRALDEYKLTITPV